MMTQSDPGPMPPNEIAQDTVDAVRRALERHVNTADAEPAPELRAALHSLAREARQKSISPEHLLVALKNIWRALPDVEHARTEDEQTRILQRVVAVCIKEYFAD
ncbi:MAG TPA: Clp protease N-terminal domain-containing protein [Gemmatimonadaceae bacterium]|jgi:uncharacterized protein (DUF2267 family)